MRRTHAVPVRNSRLHTLWKEASSRTPRRHLVRPEPNRAWLVCDFQFVAPVGSDIETEANAGLATSIVAPQQNVVPQFAKAHQPESVPMFLFPCASSIVYCRVCHIRAGQVERIVELIKKRN